MNLIKKIFAWIFALIAEIFKKKKKSKKTNNKKENISVEEQFSNKKNNIKTIDAIPDTTLPAYMLISDQDKDELINKIRNMRVALLSGNDIKEKSIEQIIDILNDNISEECEYDVASIEKYLAEQDFSKLSPHKINLLLAGYDDETKEKVNEIIVESIEISEKIDEAVDNLDGIIEYVEDNDVSLATRDFIEEEVLEEDEEVTLDENSLLYNKDILNTIENWDKSIVDKTKLTYDVVNYVTLTTVMLDDIVNEYDRVLDDYQHRRYNKRYYEEQLGRIKEKIEYLRDIKNSRIVYDEIVRLRKELDTKSKDKYDVLYNNEIFIDINNRCDILLEKVNRKVVDIKSKEKTKEDKDKEPEEEKDKDKDKDRLRDILLRFQDVGLGNSIVKSRLEKFEKARPTNINEFINWMYADFIKGVDEPFNFDVNKARTELACLFNDLHVVLTHVKGERPVKIEHINFLVDDLVNAVSVLKFEVEQVTDPKELADSSLVDEKINTLREKFVEKKESKTYVKSGKRVA